MKKIFIRIVLLIIFFTPFYTVLASDVNLTIRDGDQIIYSNSIPVQMNSNVLSILNDADLLSDDFTVSNVQNFSFGSYLKCMIILGDERCDDWQYTVDGVYPGYSIDQYNLSGGENIYIYFGPQNKISLSSADIKTSDTLSVTAQKYNYQNNTWITRAGVTVGLTQTDPDNPWTPIEIQTQAVDGDGNAVFSSIPAGSYNVGIKEDFYFPTELLTVTTLINSGGFVYKTPPLSIPRAIDYLKDAHQIYRADTDSDLYTDWATIAYSAAGVLDDVHDLVFSNLKNYNVPSSLLTDNERRTMVLLSIGENPYSFSGVNYVKIITDDFDGVQFGDNLWVNDDIFALIPLASVGYISDDDIIIKDVTFVLSRQNQGNSSWENSVDLTAAAIQALFPFKSIPGVSVAISNASNYLQNMQRENGGWESVYATSWAMQAMTTLNVLWSRGGQGPIEYFNSQQAEDGAILLSETSVKNKMWATSYVIPAVLGKPWSSIFKKFPKMIENENPEKNVINVEKLNKKVITKQELTDLELIPQALTASIIESDILVNKQSFLKTAGLDVLNFIQNGIHQLSRLFSF